MRTVFEQYAEILTFSLVTCVTANRLWTWKDETEKALWSQAPCFTDNLEMQRKSVAFFCGSVISLLTVFLRIVSHF